jgi:uncharacterized protein (DUF302 family)
MSYYFSKSIDCDFDKAIERVTEVLKKKGFGVLTDIDVQATLKKKIDADIYKYRILGACSPLHAHQAIMAEDKVGVFLPCNVIVQQKNDGGLVEVSAVDPLASMQAIENPELGALAQEVTMLMKSIIDDL